jgi:hypothetical protein
VVVAEVAMEVAEGAADTTTVVVEDTAVVEEEEDLPMTTVVAVVDTVAAVEEGTVVAVEDTIVEDINCHDESPALSTRHTMHLLVSILKKPAVKSSASFSCLVSRFLCVSFNYCHLMGGGSFIAD